ncbi:nucleotide exchange factor GrpE [Lapillicoccus sp.]|uniref:nucleotide exchange factor GrpE n=1 Tax=Lapillicoccus sp. TaxID=1909287 RepID=UPI0025FAD512|nr:nucleotide exchange factor GrpE [Lapillicoccus sp.]
MTDHPGEFDRSDHSGQAGSDKPDEEIVIEPDEVVVERAGSASVDPGDDDYDAAIEAEFFNTEAQNDGVTAHDGVTPESAGGATASVAPGAANVDYLEDLRRLQAEYVNYKRRVDRDRDVAKEQGVGQVVVSLLPVLDDIHLAREHGDLEGTPFASIADKLDGILGRFGVTRLGAAGEEFDPAVHEALMHVEADLPEGTTATTVVQVLQPGFKVGERVVRPARVSVADPR